MLFQFKIFEPFKSELRHGISQRTMGSFKDGDLKLRLSQTPTQFFAEQIHGDDILEIPEEEGENLKGDAFITNQKTKPLGVKTADCQGVLIYDPVKKVTAAVHAGWKGSTLQIIKKTVEKLSTKYQSDPADLHVGIGPSLGPCCAEFSDPRTELPKFIHPYINGKKVDFWNLSLDECIAAGIPESQIEIAKICTKCDSNYYSYRNGNSERMAVFIEMK